MKIRYLEKSINNRKYYFLIQYNELTIIEEYGTYGTSKPKTNKKSVLMPNDPEILNLKNRLKYGIPIDDNTFKDMNALSKKFNINLKFLN